VGSPVPAHDPAACPKVLVAVVRQQRPGAHVTTSSQQPACSLARVSPGISWTSPAAAQVSGGTGPAERNASRPLIDTQESWLSRPGRTLIAEEDLGAAATAIGLTPDAVLSQRLGQPEEERARRGGYWT
jgi:hypothetical protein